MRTKIRGWHGWALLVGVVGVIDILALSDETMSDAAHRAVRKYPLAVSTLVGLTSAHLLIGHNARWRKVDPFYAMGHVRKWTVR